MLRHLSRAILVSLVFFVLCGLAYPAVEVAIGQGLFAHEASGSLGRNGSTLIGQSFTGPRWFEGRPEPADNNPLETGGSNLGPRSKVLVQHVRERISALERAGIRPTNDLVTSSGSGLDPDISPASAYAQARAVAKANHLSLARVDRLIAAHEHGRELGFLGSPYVDVLQLNEALAVAARHR